MTQTATSTTDRVLGIGIAGIGQGGGGILPIMASMPELRLAAGADINPLTRRRFLDRYADARVYESVEQLCDDPDVEAVWVSTPNRFHCEHALAAMQRGRHVIVEKPMAVSLEEASRMVDAAARYGVTLIAGHTNSYELPVRAMRKVVQSGVLGDLCAVHIWSYTDWMLRARTPDELDPDQGGGIPWRQGPHQIDVVRLLGGGMLRSVRAMTGRWMKERPIPGYHCAYMEFDNGAPATVIHNGYGYFQTAEMFPWALDRLRYTPDELTEIRRLVRSGTRDEEGDKQAFRIGGSREPSARRPGAQSEPQPWTPADLGMVLVTCERGDIRNSKRGLYVYGDGGRQEIVLQGHAAGLSEHRGELEELYDVVVRGGTLYHGGEWGLATLEACIGMMESARDRREVMLTRQIPMPAGYDAGLELPVPQPSPVTPS